MNRLTLIPLLALGITACTHQSALPPATWLPPTPQEELTPVIHATPSFTKPPSTPTMSVVINARPGAIYKDVTYCTASATDPTSSDDRIALKMDIYYPSRTFSTSLDKNDLKALPVAVYVHGGGWTTGDKGSGAGIIDTQGLLARGYLVVSINYRLAPQFKFPAQIEDVKCAIRHLRATAAVYNLDPNRIGVWGGSAGGHLVALLGTTDKSVGWDVGEYIDQSSRVQAVVDLFGPADLTQMFPGLSIIVGQSVFGASTQNDPILLRASPVTYISPDDPPFLILQGDKDTTVPPSQSQTLYDRLKVGGVPATLVMVKNAGHSFTPVGGAIDPTREELTNIIADFFDQHLL